MQQYIFLAPILFGWLLIGFMFLMCIVTDDSNKVWQNTSDQGKLLFGTFILLGGWLAIPIAMIFWRRR